MDPNQHEPTQQMQDENAAVEEETVAAAGDEATADTEMTREQLEAELSAANDRWIRSQAELENFTKRARRELSEQVRYAAVPLLNDLLGVMDNLQRAIDSAKSSDEGQGLLQGVEMVAVQLQQTLENHGCRPISSVGESFDPNRHEAVIMEPTSEHAPNTVIRELRSGYELHDRVLRPPQVVVSAAPPEQA